MWHAVLSGSGSSLISPKTFELSMENREISGENLHISVAWESGISSPFLSRVLLKVQGIYEVTGATVGELC